MRTDPGQPSARNFREVRYDPDRRRWYFLSGGTGESGRWSQISTPSGTGGGGSPTGSAGGDLSGSYPNPQVDVARGLRDSGGTEYPMGAVGSGDFLRESGGNIVGASFASTLADALLLALFGDGSDGNVTLGSNIVLTRDMNYQDLNLNGFTITTRGCAIRVRGTLSGTGTIERNGPNAVGTAAGPTDGGASGTFGAGQQGSNGGNSANGSNVAALANSWTRAYTGSGSGGTGGASGAGQSAGTVTAPTTHATARFSLFSLDTGHLIANGTAAAWRGGGGGSGGGGGAASQGGGGGGGGGVLIVHARIWNSTCTVSSIGGAGANAAGSNAGGGGGGQGGKILVVSMRYDSTPTLTAAGGSGGSSVGTGTASASGGSGHTDQLLLAA